MVGHIIGQPGKNLCVFWKAKLVWAQKMKLSYFVKWFHSIILSYHVIEFAKQQPLIRSAVLKQDLPDKTKPKLLGKVYLISITFFREKKCFFHNKSKDDENGLILPDN